MSRRRGFTLIELLVVIAIIAILAAILFPVFAQARAAARKTQCLSNVKQLTLGVMQYVQDYDERFWGWNWTYNCNGGNNGGPRDSAAFWAPAIYPYVKNTGVYRCPDDILQWNDMWSNCSDDGGRHDIFGGYRANGTLCDGWMGCNPNYVSYGVAENLDGDMVNNKLASIQTPANWMLLADGASQLIDNWVWGTPDPSTDNWISARSAFASQPEGCCMMWQCCWTASQWFANYSTSVLDRAARHAGGENLSYVDGHAKFQRWTNETWLKETIGSR